MLLRIELREVQPLSLSFSLTLSLFLLLLQISCGPQTQKLMQACLQGKGQLECSAGLRLDHLPSVICGQGQIKWHGEGGVWGVCVCVGGGPCSICCPLELWLPERLDDMMAGYHEVDL